MYMSKPGRPHVDNDVNIPPAQTLTVTKHTWCEQVDNDVKITHPPKKPKKNMQNKLYRYQLPGGVTGYYDIMDSHRCT